jgi:hypothetical protein
MANNYTQMSMCIGEEWPDEAKEDLVHVFEAIDSYELDLAPEWFRKEFETEHEGEDFVEYVEDELSGYSRVIYRFEKDAQDKNLYIYSDESANIEAVAQAIHAVQRHFEIEMPITFTFADTCSKPRVGEFGGGVVAVTKNGVQSWHTNQGLPTVDRVCWKNSGDGLSKLAMLLSGKAERAFMRYIGDLEPDKKKRAWNLLGKGDFRQYRKDTLRNWLYADNVEVSLIKDFLGQIDESLFRYIRFGREYDDYEMKGSFENRFRLDFKTTPDRVIVYDIPE